MEKGKWFFYWKKVQGRICDSDYKFLSEEDYKHIYEDEGVHICEVEGWAESVSNLGHASFEYGFNEVEKPPVEWLEKKTESLIREIQRKQELIEIIKEYL